MKSGSVCDKVCTEWLKILPPIFKENNRKNIFNTHKTEVIFKCFTKKTMAIKGEICHGGVILLFYDNMDGSKKFKTFLIRN